MNKKCVYIMVMVAACLIACRNETEQEQPLEWKDIFLENSLVQWTADTVMNENPELVMLLDTLYQHRNDSIGLTLEKEMQWIKTYRRQLCAYYDRHQLGNDTVAEYAKVDTVLNVAERLYELDDDLSTMGIVVNNNICSYFDAYREYNMFDQLLTFSENDEVRKMLYQEWTLYNQMAQTMYMTCGDVTDLVFWGGSIRHIIYGSKLRDINSAKKEMYENVMMICKDEDIEDKYGVYPKCAETLLFDCIRKSIKDAVDGEMKFRKSEGEDIDTMYMKIAHTAERRESELRPLVDQWISLWEKLDEELTQDYSRHEIERVCAAMLVRWASIVSSKW